MSGPASGKARPVRTYDPGKKPGTGQSRRTATPAPRLHAVVRRSAVDNVPRSPGQPLGAPLTEEMCAHPGADFARVPAHADSEDKDTLALQRSIGNAALARLLGRAQDQHGAGGGPPDRAAVALQPGIGNAALSRMLGRAGHAPAAVQRAAVQDVLRAPGQPLSAPVKQEMEGRLGADFSQVRVHTDSASRASAADIGARGYTSGCHVVIGENGSDEYTLAHELTHVIQQRSGPVSGTDTGQGLSLSDPSDRFEREADANAHRIMAGGDRSPALQRAMDTSDGEATPARGGERAAVQRYVDIEPGAQNYPSKHRRRFIGSNKSAENDEHFFPSQSETGGSYFAPAEAPTANVTYNGRVRLRFSDSSDLAVEQGTGESKVFFATEAHIQAANKALAGRVRFRKGTRYLLVQGQGQGLRLYQVKPVVETKRTGVAGMLGMTKKATGLSILTPQRCNEMAEFVTGKTGLSAEGISSWENFLARVLDIVERSGSKHLVGVKEAFQKGVNGDQEAYLAYSQEMSRTFQGLEAGELEIALRKLGLNQFLPPPPPGSALATVGYGNAEQEAGRDGERTFEYHFGATVATSGNNYVTMENYARRDPRVGNVTASGGDPLFFFKMYGTEPESGETWHGVQASSGSFIGAILSITIEG